MIPLVAEMAGSGAELPAREPAAASLTAWAQPLGVETTMEMEEMNEEDIRALVAEMDTTRLMQAENAWLKLRDLGQEVVPFLSDAYSSFRKWQGRVALVFHSIRYARSSDAAFQLGLAALRDRATLVRYRACGLLAYSLRGEAIPHLQELLSHPDGKTVEDARAAIDAIEHQNHHYFVDRGHSGRSFWQVNGGDAAEL